MKIALASDHRGFKLKKELLPYLKQYDVTDFGANNEESCDYPDYALKVAKAVSSGEFERGILICSTGLGMSIAANKVHGIRAALCLNQQMARQSREHIDSNILVLGADLISSKKAKVIISEWLSAEFSKEERHARRIGKIEQA
jgi:ribose 5-phosphate isomerase B